MIPQIMIMGSKQTICYSNFLFFIIIFILSYHYDQKTGFALFDRFKYDLRLNLGIPKLVCPKSVYQC